MPVVSNTSPVSNLAIVGHLHLLHQRYGKVLIPRKVKEELDALSHPRAREAVEQALLKGWLTICGLKDPAVTLAYEARVDAGEAAAIALAEEVRADKVLMDDRLGHLLARERGLRLRGVLGELLHARLQGWIPSFSDIVEQLRKEARFFVREDLKTLLIREAGE